MSTYAIIALFWIQMAADDEQGGSFVEISPHGHDLQTDAATDYAVDARSAASTDYSTNPSFVQLHLETSTQYRFFIVFQVFEFPHFFESHLDPNSNLKRRFL